MLYREGDLVTLRGRVVFNQDASEPQVHIDLDGDHTAKLVVDAKAVTLMQRAFKVGDKVTWHHDAENLGEVVATAGKNMAALMWVRTSNKAIELHGEFARLNFPQEATP